MPDHVVLDLFGGNRGGGAAEEMNLGVLSLGASDPLMATCGVDPCGFTDFFAPSAECDTWNMCAQTQAGYGAPQILTMAGNGECVVGGVDAFGDTIIHCAEPMPCLTGQGPLQPGQVRCSDIYTTMAGIPADPSEPLAGSSGKVIMLAGAALLLFALVKR